MVGIVEGLVTIILITVETRNLLRRVVLAHRMLAVETRQLRFSVELTRAHVTRIVFAEVPKGVAGGEPLVHNQGLFAQFSLLSGLPMDLGVVGLYTVV